VCGGGGEARRSQWADYTQPERGPRQAALVVPRRCYKNTTGRKRSPENCCDCCVAENASRTCRAGIYEREVPSLLALGFIYRFTSGLAQAFTLHLFLLASFACSHHVPVPSQQMAHSSALSSKSSCVAIGNLEKSKKALITIIHFQNLSNKTVMTV